MRREQPGATLRVIAHPTPAGPRRRWPARSASPSPDRASMARRWSTTRSWGRDGARRRSRHRARSRSIAGPARSRAAHWRLWPCWGGKRRCRMGVRAGGLPWTVRPSPTVRAASFGSIDATGIVFDAGPEAIPMLRLAAPLSGLIAIEQRRHGAGPSEPGRTRSRSMARRSAQLCGVEAQSRPVVDEHCTASGRDRDVTPTLRGAKETKALETKCGGDQEPIAAP